MANVTKSALAKKSADVGQAPKRTLQVTGGSNPVTKSSYPRKAAGPVTKAAYRRNSQSYGDTTAASGRTAPGGRVQRLAGQLRSRLSR